SVLGIDDILHTIMMNVVFNIFIILLSIITMQHLYGCSSKNGGKTTTTTSGPATTTTSPSTPFPTSPPGKPHPTGLYAFNGEIQKGVNASFEADFPQQPDIINYLNVTVVAVKVFAKNVHYHFIGNTNNMEMKVSDIPSQYQAIMKTVGFAYFHANESIRITIGALSGSPSIYLTRK
ncbi:hypothetical protein Pmar_PMAR022238, partial [Perkinsus marinus ATCC 50983]